MNIALTGGTGYIGSHILTELVSHGHVVTAAVRTDAEAASGGGGRVGARWGLQLGAVS